LWERIPLEKSQHSERYRRLLLELKLARVRAGLTQAQAAKKLKTYKSYVSKVEQAERKIDVVELAELCTVYGVRLLDLLQAAKIE
jgi:transcriptional regulator with XRE-family HTH domain